MILSMERLSTQMEVSIVGKLLTLKEKEKDNMSILTKVNIKVNGKIMKRMEEVIALLFRYFRVQ